MIKLHRFDGSSFVLNADLIEAVEATPDTVVRLHTGKVFVVTDPVDAIVDAVIAYRRAIFVELPVCRREVEA